MGKSTPRGYWNRRQREELWNRIDAYDTQTLDELQKHAVLESARLEKEIAHYYANFGNAGVLEYKNLLLALPDAEREILYQDFASFAEKYPSYAHLAPIRASFYNLNRLEGLNRRMLLHSYNIGAIEEDVLRESLTKTASYVGSTCAAMLGDGVGFWADLEQVANRFVGHNWTGKGNYSSSIWKNKEKLAEYLNKDFVSSVQRGDSLQRMTKSIRSRFVDVSKYDAERLLRTESAYIMCEASAYELSKEWEEYEYTAILDKKTSQQCQHLDGKIFKFTERRVGLNFPPLHPHCRSDIIPVASSLRPKRLERPPKASPKPLNGREQAKLGRTPWNLKSLAEGRNRGFSGKSKESLEFDIHSSDETVRKIARQKAIAKGRRELKQDLERVIGEGLHIGNNVRDLLAHFKSEYFVAENPITKNVVYAANHSLADSIIKHLKEGQLTEADYMDMGLIIEDFDFYGENVYKEIYAQTFYKATNRDGKPKSVFEIGIVNDQNKGAERIAHFQYASNGLKKIKRFKNQKRYYIDRLPREFYN